MEVNKVKNQINLLNMSYESSILIDDSSSKYNYEVDSEKEKISEEKKSHMMAKIIAKLKMGKKLTSEEMAFLEKYNPTLYKIALRAQFIRKQLEEEFKKVRSKEEANRVAFNAFSSISDKDPSKEYMHAAIENITKQFRMSGFYNRLPNVFDKTSKKAEKENFFRADEDSEKDDNNDNDINFLKNWTPIQEIIDNMPKFDTKA